MFPIIYVMIDIIKVTSETFKNVSMKSRNMFMPSIILIPVSSSLSGLPESLRNSLILTANLCVNEMITVVRPP